MTTTQFYDTGATAGTYRSAERRTFTETKLGFKTSEFAFAPSSPPAPTARTRSPSTTAGSTPAWWPSATS